MSDLVENPEDRFSRVAAQLRWLIGIGLITIQNSCTISAVADLEGVRGVT